MNSIVCNCCLSGYIYRKQGRQFDNPFFWNRITCKDFIKLVRNYRNLDYTNLDLIKNDDLKDMNPLDIGPNQFSVILEDIGVRVQFNHVKFSPRDMSPKVERINEYQGNTFYSKPYELVLEAFLRRSRRYTAERRNNTLFVFVDNAPQYDSPQDIRDLLETAAETKERLVLVTRSSGIESTEYTRVVTIPPEDFTFERIAENYIDLFM